MRRRRLGFSAFRFPRSLRSFREGIFFFFLRDDTNLLRKDITKACLRIGGEKHASKLQQKQASKTPLHAAHTQPTPALKTPHTPRHPHSNKCTIVHQGSKHYPRQRTYCLQASELFQKAPQSSGKPHHWGTNMPGTTAGALP